MNTSTSLKTNAAPRLRPAPWDALVVAVIVALTAALVFFLLPKGGQSGALTCTISQNGTVLDTFSIGADDADTEKVYGDYIVELSAGQVRVEEAPCANQDCVHTGWISRAGQSIVCLPGRFVVELKSDSGEQPFDAVLR